MKLRLPLLAILVLLFTAPFSRAESCTAVIIDQANVILAPATIYNAAMPLTNQGADVHVVTVDSLNGYGSLSAVEAHYEQVCPNWTNPQTGQRKANLFVIMVAPNDHVKNIFLGSYYNGAFDVSSTYSQYANSYFSKHEWEAGIAITLYKTTSLATAYRQRNINAINAQQRQRAIPTPQRVYTAPPIQTQNSDSGMSGLAIFFIVLIVLSIIGILCYFLFRDTPSSTTTVDTDPGYSSPTNFEGDYARSYRSRSYAAAAPSHTTVINNGGTGGGDFVEGMIVGDLLSSRQPNPNPVYVEPAAPVYVEPAAPVYVDPTPSYVEPTPAQDAPDSTWIDSSPSDSSFGGDSGGGSSGGDSSW